MKISYNWLRTYLPVDLSPERMAEILTQTGLEVEGVDRSEAIPGGLKGLVIGEVLECKPHENADRLRVTQVNAGGETPLQIVCGAPNVAAGQKVVVATIGAELHPTGGEPFKIKKGKIRGEVSEGMICAEDEIGLGQGHEGIMVLNEEAQVGQTAAEHFQLEDDFTIEIGLTPNRTDGMSHLGVARDLRAALRNMADIEERTELDVAWPEIDWPNSISEEREIPVEVRDSARCPRYCGVTIKDVKVGPSPDWLQERLRSIGHAPVNNVVDITNFVLHETGHPLHAFDADQIEGGKVIVQTLTEGTPFTTLDEVDRKLNEEDLVICDGENNPMCIAGVFGGIRSGVTETTKDVFLEGAYFNPVSIRKSAKRHGLSTDASFRYERGVDPNLAKYALQRAALLMCEIAGGTVSSAISDSQPEPLAATAVPMKWEHIDRLIGMSIPREICTSILSDLDIAVTDENAEGFTARVAPYRVDVTREADVIEEILRIYGFNNIPFPEKLNTSLSHSPKPDLEKIQHRISDALVSRGFSETMSNSLTKGSYAEGIQCPELALEERVDMLNPLSQDLLALRQSLVFSGLEAIERNQNFRNPDLRLFEFGKTYHKRNGAYVESRRMAIFLTGRRQKESWNTSDDAVTFTDLKRAVEFVLLRLGLNQLTAVEPLKHALWHEGLRWEVRNKEVVRFGSLALELQQRFGIKQPVYWADFDWEAITTMAGQQKVKVAELPKFPSVRRDLSLLVDQAVTFSQLSDVARRAEKKLLQHVDLFDVYDGKNLPDGKKSYALQFVLMDRDKTLTDKQIDKVMSNIQRALEEKSGAELR